jgi:signal transduction histidine kinase
MRVTGSPRTLPPGQALCAYRVAQEALTNVLKHAARSNAVLSLDYRPDGLAMRIADNGAGTPTEPNPGGQGLIGMRERAGMYGGSVVSGPLPDGGFRTELWLPHPQGGETLEPRSALNDQRAGGR